MSRSYSRTYAPGHHFGFKGFSPFTRPAWSRWPRVSRSSIDRLNIDKLYALKGDIVARGVKSALGFDMPVFENAAFSTGPLGRFAPRKHPRPRGGTPQKIPRALFLTPPRAGLTYPDAPSARSRWILGHRGRKNRLDPNRPYAWL
ncbi:MAG: hypothetical protein CM1200mP29_06330 [Verrucomicrobiota bacterium]|nr:MAG: hypothetical protein CM1200mP29_06330 [Verrucomicrobiota bacterium]